MRSVSNINSQHQNRGHGGKNKASVRLTVSAPAPTERILLAIHPGTAGAGSTSNLASSSGNLSLSTILLGSSGNATAGLPSPTASHAPSSSALTTPPRLRNPPVTTSTRSGNLRRISRAESRKKPSRAAVRADVPGRGREFLVLSIYSRCENSWPSHHRCQE